MYATEAQHNAAQREAQANKEMFPMRIVFLLIYFVQKMSNHMEGVSKIPIRNLLKKPEGEGGFGLDPAEAGKFMSDSAVGWYIKALFGIITDNVPIFGYRRKSWLIITSICAGAIWIALAISGASTVELLFFSLVFVNIALAFGDVICDGLMVQYAQFIEQKHQLEEESANRPLQIAQWTGALIAMLIGAFAGGIIAQLFDLKVAAIIAGTMPMLLTIVIALGVKEERVKAERGKMLKGIIAIGVSAGIAFAVIQLNAADPESFFGAWSWLIQPVMIIGTILCFVQPGRDLWPPILLITCWTALPFNFDSQYLYQYFTQDNTAFLEVIQGDSGLVAGLKDILIALKMATPESLEGGFQEIFFGSVLFPFYVIGMGFGLIAFHVLWKKKPIGRIFVGCLCGVIVSTGCFSLFPIAGVTSPIFLIFCVLLAGFMGIVALFTMLFYAASKIPGDNQATLFALVMGMANLGTLFGVEKAGGAIYASFHVSGEEAVGISPETILSTAHSGMISVIAVSLCCVCVVFTMVVVLGQKGYVKFRND